MRLNPRLPPSAPKRGVGRPFKHAAAAEAETETEAGKRSAPNVLSNPEAPNRLVRKIITPPKTTAILPDDRFA